MRNIVEGYGDRYLSPTHTLLDTLTAEYGYEAAGQSLASAREQSRRMVVQGQAAVCDYAEPARRAAAIRFVVHAFNGSVDSILPKVKSDNFGVLQQRIRDAYSPVNLEGVAFRNARILPEFLDARLSQLKWAVVVHELALRDREEQRYQKEQERDRQKAEQERLRKLRNIEKEKEAAAKEQQLKQAILAEAESRLALAQSQDERRRRSRRCEDYNRRPHGPGVNNDIPYEDTVPHARAVWTPALLTVGRRPAWSKGGGLQAEGAAGGRAGRTKRREEERRGGAWKHPLKPRDRALASGRFRVGGKGSKVTLAHSDGHTVETHTALPAAVDCRSLARKREQRHRDQRLRSLRRFTRIVKSPIGLCSPGV